MLLTARETADLLGIKLDTLYAYVSRGLLASVEIANSRERHYDAEEVERFRTGRGVRAQSEALTPLIGSAICLIEDHRLYYRGHDALALADSSSLEDVAAILWQEEGPTLTPTLRRQQGRGMTATSALPPPLAGEGRGGGEATLGALEHCQIRLAELATTDHAALDLTHAGVMRTGRLILGELATVVGGTAAEDLIHEQLGAAWRLDTAGTDLVRRCLVLLADHELNASTFVARCVASTGATPYAVVTAALAALSGRRHGGQSARVEALCRELAAGGDPLAAMAARLARDELLPGLGQPLYPEGDPRAAAILAAAKAAVPARAEWIERVAAAATRLGGRQPNVDFGLGVAATVLDLPPGAALGMFLVARAVGWIAHAVEQYDTGVLIRPRARYIGRRPGGAPNTARRA